MRPLALGVIRTPPSAGLPQRLAERAAHLAFHVGAHAAQGGIGQLWNGNLGNNFYNLFPHNLLVGIFAPVFLFVVFAVFVVFVCGVSSKYNTP